VTKWEVALIEYDNGDKIVTVITDNVTREEILDYIKPGMVLKDGTVKSVKILD
jgi:hypothetical protein